VQPRRLGRAGQGRAGAGRAHGDRGRYCCTEITPCPPRATGLPAWRTYSGSPSWSYPLRPLVGDQAPPRRPEYVSLLPHKEGIGGRDHRNRKRLDRLRQAAPLALRTHDQPCAAKGQHEKERPRVEGHRDGRVPPRDSTPYGPPGRRSCGLPVQLPHGRRTWSAWAIRHETGKQANAPGCGGAQRPRAFAPHGTCSARKSAYGPSAVTSADGCMLGRSNVETSW
jgi:hypothetical protein